MAHSNHAVWGGYPPSMSVIGEELPGAEQTLAPDTPPSHSVKTQAPPASSVTETWHPPAVASSVLVQVDDADGSERWVLATVQSHTRASERSPCTSFVAKLPANAGASRMPRQERLTRATEGSSWRRMMPKRNERIEAEVDWGEGELEWAKARVLKRLFATGEFTAVICYPDGTEDDEFVETYKLDAEESSGAGPAPPYRSTSSRVVPSLLHLVVDPWCFGRSQKSLTPTSRVAQRGAIEALSSLSASASATRFACAATAISAAAANAQRTPRKSQKSRRPTSRVARRGAVEAGRARGRATRPDLTARRSPTRAWRGSSACTEQPSGGAGRRS